VTQGKVWAGAHVTEVRDDVGKLAERLAEPKPMRRGSVSERSMRCGRTECRCQQDPGARHGPYYSLTRAEGGKTRSRYLTAEQAALARQQVEAGQEFRRHVEEYWQACEQWADAHLDTVEAASQEAAKKGGSKRRLKPRSSPKSRRSSVGAPSTTGTSRRSRPRCVSSGVVEAGCKVAIGTRCKRAGMHWTIAGVVAIIALRCCKLSGRFEDFWERRAKATRQRRPSLPRAAPVTAAPAISQC
jgi:hypothetical protein